MKNNLQTVAALLRLQGRRSSEPAVRAALSDAQVRVAAIAVVHEALSGDSGTEADFEESIDFDHIVTSLFAVVGEETGMTLERSGDAGRLRADLATPLAMCVSELLHNAVQHSGGTYVKVQAVRDADRLRIDITDDGVGVAGDWRDQAGSGTADRGIVSDLGAGRNLRVGTRAVREPSGGGVSGRRLGEGRKNVAVSG